MTVHAFDRNRGAVKEEQEWTREAPPSRDSTPDPHHKTSTVPDDYRQIKGWGVDLHNRPMFPMELPSDVKTVRGNVRDWQVPHQKIFMSVEQPNLTPVFGTSCPPRGLSGLLRSYAYRYSEGTNRHWMTLLIADRVDIVESMISGVFRGKPDHYFEEKGWSAKAKYGANPGRSRATGLAIGAAMVAGFALTMYLTRED